MQTELEINDLVVRHNKLINAKIRLSSKEYDLIRTFMKYIQRKDSDFWSFSVLASELGINNSRGKPMVRNIQRKPIEIEIGKDGIISIPFFTTLKYNNGIFEGKFNTDLKKVLLEIEGDFTKTFEKYILPMESVYAKRIYELLIENKRIGYRKFRLEQLQDILDIPKSMKSFSRFKEKVLLIAIKEINKHSDIYIPVDITNLKDESWIKLQCGKARKITHLNFEFRKKDDKEPTEEPKQTQATQSIQEPKKVTYELVDKEIDRDMIFHFTNCDTIEKKQSLNNKIEEFIKYCIDNQKEYENYENSFSRYLEIAKQNNWNF